MSEIDDEPTVFLAGGMPIDLSEIADFGDSFYSEYDVVPVEKVNSFTADQSEDVVYRGYGGFVQSQTLVADPILANDLKACERGEIDKPSLSRKLEIDLVASPPSFAAAAAKSSFAEEVKVGPTAPATPFLLMDTHFHCKCVDLNSVVNRVEEELNNIPEVSREFDQKKCSVSFPILFFSNAFTTKFFSCRLLNCDKKIHDCKLSLDCIAPSIKTPEWEKKKHT